MGTPVQTAACVGFRGHIDLAPEPRSVGVGRRWLRDTLKEIDHQFEPKRVDDMVTCLSELLTNVPKHAKASRCSVFLVCLTSQVDAGDSDCDLELQQIFVGVSDNDPVHKPLPQLHRELSTNGRGLEIVAALADNWYCRTYEKWGQKVVWAQFERGQGDATVSRELPNQLQRQHR